MTDIPTAAQWARQLRIEAENKKIPVKSERDLVFFAMALYMKWLHDNPERIVGMPEGERIDLFFSEVVDRLVGR